jgi:hypothetical protein
MRSEIAHPWRGSATSVRRIRRSRVPWRRSRRVVMVSIVYTNTMALLVSDVNTKKAKGPGLIAIAVRARL